MQKIDVAALQRPCKIYIEKTGFVVPLTGLSWNQLAAEINEFAAIFRESSSQV